MRRKHITYFSFVYGYCFNVQKRKYTEIRWIKTFDKLSFQTYHLHIFEKSKYLISDHRFPTLASRGLISLYRLIISDRYTIIIKNIFSCASQLNLNWTKIKDCSEGSLGNRLYHEVGNIAALQNTMIPYILINGHAGNSSEQTQYFKNFKKSVQTYLHLAP